jgi:hypothetical protein
MTQYNKKFLQALKEKMLESQENELIRGKNGRKFELRKQEITQGFIQAHHSLETPLHIPHIHLPPPENPGIMKRKTTPRTGEIQKTHKKHSNS